MKKVTVILLSLLLCIGLFACGKDKDASDSSTDNNTDNNTVKIEKNIDAVAEHLGFKGGEKTLYDTIGAEDGKEYNDGSVELYEFKEDSNEYKDIVNGEGSIKAAAHKDGIILVFPNDPDQKIIDQFNEINFK